MRSLYIPLICLLLVFVFWITSSSYTDRTVNTLIPALEETRVFAVAEDWENASASHDRFLQLWNEYYSVYCYYINSSDMEELQRSVACFFGCLEAKDLGLVCREAENTTALLKDLTIENEFRADNIL
mgnify:CR=1 FL=1